MVGISSGFARKFYSHRDGGGGLPGDPNKAPREPTAKKQAEGTGLDGHLWIDRLAAEGNAENRQFLLDIFSDIENFFRTLQFSYQTDENKSDVTLLVRGEKTQAANQIVEKMASTAQALFVYVQPTNEQNLKNAAEFLMVFLMEIIAYLAAAPDGPINVELEATSSHTRHGADLIREMGDDDELQRAMMRVYNAMGLSLD